MSVLALKRRVEALIALPASAWRDTAREVFDQLIEALETGDVRAALETDDGWRSQSWVKAGLRMGLRLGRVLEAEAGPLRFLEIDTLLPRSIPASAGPLVRPGVHLGRGAALGSRAFLELGVRIGEEAEIGAGAMLGACVQVGRRARVGAGAVVAGELEPADALSPVIGDECWIGPGAILEGEIVLGRRCVLAPGLCLTPSVPVYDLVKKARLRREGAEPLQVPEGGVLLRASRRLAGSYSESVGLASEAVVISRSRGAEETAEEALSKS